MKKTIPVLLLTAGGFIWLWQYEPTPHTETAVVAQAEAPAPAAGSATRTLTGTEVAAGRHGIVQVQVVLTDGSITEVQVLRAPATKPTEEALPTLREEALNAQSAEIDTVSGATMTSEAYAESLQAALDAKGA
ncbi:FMN-binding protein [Saccharothrix sp. AJ9571]|nr:FMN-binding protein [Saccharothrix sp. AJ9571]